MHIAHFIQRYPPALGGSEAYCHRLGQHLVELGHRITVWTTVAEEVSAFWSPRGKCFAAGETTLDDVAVKRYPLWRMRGRRWLLKPLSLIPLRAWQALTLPCNPVSVRMWRDAGATTEKYDAVHATAFPYAWPIACAHRLAKRLGVPFYLTPFLHLGDLEDGHNQTRQQYLQPALRRLLCSADGVFVQTDPEYDAALQVGVKPDRIIRQGLGVDASECTGGDRMRARAAWGVNNDDIVIGHLANLSVEKGTVDLVQALGSSPSSLVLAGPAMPNFERTHVADPRIIRTGPLTDQQKRDFFAGIDIFALPSRSDSFGLVLLEAWANGVPIVAYRAGGPGALVRHEVDGLLARCGDVRELAACLSTLINDVEMRKRFGAHGRARCEREFRWGDKLTIVSDVLQQHERRGFLRRQATVE